MSPRLRRALRAAATAVFGAVVGTGTVWANMMAGLGPKVMGFGHGLTPGLEVTPLSLALDIGIRAGLLLVPLWLLAVVSGPWPLRALSLGMLAYGWYFLGEAMASDFAVDFGATWAPGEAFSELFWVPRLTPALWAGAVLAYALALGRLNRVPPMPQRGGDRGLQPR